MGTVLIFDRLRWSDARGPYATRRVAARRHRDRRTARSGSLQLHARTRRRIVLDVAGLLLRFVRARLDAASRVSVRGRMRSDRRHVHDRRRVLLALVSLARRRTRHVRAVTALRAHRVDVYARVGLLQQRVQQRDVHEGPRMRSRGRVVQRQSGLLRRSVRARVRQHVAVRAAPRLSRDRRALRVDGGLLLGRVWRERSLRAGRRVHGGRREAVHARRGRCVRERQRVLLARVRDAKRRRAAMRVDRRLRAALRSMRRRRGLLLGIMRGRRDQREALRAKWMRRGRRDLQRERAVLLDGVTHVRGGLGEPRRDALRARANVFLGRRVVRGLERMLRRHLQRASFEHRVYEHVRARRLALHEERRLLRDDFRLRACLRRARVRAGHPLKELE